MKLISPRKPLLLVGAATALLLGSCAYDPYYSDVSYSQGYGYSQGYDYSQGGYGYGHGYGGSGFSTSLLISTGNPRWGYDPYSYAYYDYNRRAYYDPYLYGYYPVGYRPPVVIGVPHPHGWRRGRVMPPPSRIRTVNLSNYRDRASAYRQTEQPWARQVREDRRAYDSTSGGRRSIRQDPRGGIRQLDRSNSPAGSPALRPAERQRNPYIRERTDSRQGIRPAPAARPGTAWQDESARRGAGTRAPGIPAGYNQPVAVQPDYRQARPQRQAAVQAAPESPARSYNQPAPRGRVSPSAGRAREERQQDNRPGRR